MKIYKNELGHMTKMAAMPIYEKKTLKIIIIRVVLMSTLRFMSRRGQGHCLTLDPGLSYYDSFKHLLKATGPTETKSHLEPSGADGTKICSNPIVHMTNMATTPIYGKIL